jgi:hypothetical protein
MFIKDCPVPRPSIQDADVARQTAEKLYAELEKQQLLESDVDQGCTELSEALMSVTYLDGYELMRYLDDNFRWDADFHTCEALDLADGWARKFINEKTKLWVAEHGIEPKFKEGEVVEHLKTTMVVVGFRRDEAKYDLVAPGKSESPEVVRHVKYEDIEP